MGRPRKQERGVMGPRKLADGRQAYDVRYRNEQGQQKSKTVYDLNEANSLARDAREGRRNDQLSPTVTLGEFFARPEISKTIKREHGLGAKTVKRWKSMWKNHVCHPEYGIAGKALKQLNKKAEFNIFINEMHDAEVGEPTQARVLGICSAIIDEAVEQDLMDRNAIRLMKNKPSADRQRELYIPSIEVIEQIRLDLLTHSYRGRRSNYRQRDAMMISVMAYEAPRPEEFRGLIWDRSGRNADLMHIIAEKAKRGKSKTLHRKPPLISVVGDELEAWWQFLGGPAGHTPVLPLPQWGKRRGGEHWTEANWKDWRNRIFRPAVKRVAEKVATSEAEFEQMLRMRPYDLRHTGISLWLANGGKDAAGEWDGSPANPVDVADWAGHEVGTMWENYAHVVKSAPRIPIAQQILSARDKLGLDPVTGIVRVEATQQLAEAA